MYPEQQAEIDYEQYQKQRQLTALMLRRRIPDDDERMMFEAMMGLNEPVSMSGAVDTSTRSVPRVG